MLLNELAFVPGCDGNGNAIYIKKATFKTIMKLHEEDRDPDELYPTKFAIADGFFISRSAVLDSMTNPELQCIALAQSRASIRLLKSAKHVGLNSHFLTWNVSDRPMFRSVPHGITGSNLIIFAGPLTSQQKLVAKAKNRINIEKIMQGADYKFANDRDYRGIKRDFSFNADVVKDAVQTLSFPDGTENQRDLEVLLRDVDARCESIRQPEDSANSENSQTTEPSIAEIEITERASAIVNMESADGVQQIQSAISYCHYLMSQSPESSDQVPSSILVGRHSGVILQLKLKELVWSFPALFPDGRGGPDEQNRHYKYSFKALIDHYLSLAAHKFRNDNSFVLFAYDRLATNAAINGISLTCANNPELAENAASLRPDVLKSYFDWQLLSREARINFSEPPPLPFDLIN